MITAYYYKLIVELAKDGKLSPHMINRYVEGKCLKVIKKIEQYIVKKGMFGTAYNHISAIGRIIEFDGYELNNEVDLEDKVNYSKFIESQKDFYDVDVELFPSVKLEKICGLIVDDSLDYDTRYRLIKMTLYL